MIQGYYYFIRVGIVVIIIIISVVKPLILLNMSMTIKDCFICRCRRFFLTVSGFSGSVVAVDTSTCDCVGLDVDVDVITRGMVFAAPAGIDVAAAAAFAGHGVVLGATDVWENNVDGDAQSMYMRVGMCRMM